MYTVCVDNVKLEFITSKTVLYCGRCFALLPFMITISRIHGRILRMDFVKDHSFTEENEDLLQFSLKGLVGSNKVCNILYQLLV